MGNFSNGVSSVSAKVGARWPRRKSLSDAQSLNPSPFFNKDSCTRGTAKIPKARTGATFSSSRRDRRANCLTSRLGRFAAGTVPSGCSVPASGGAKGVAVRLSSLVTCSCLSGSMMCAVCQVLAHRIQRHPGSYETLPRGNKRRRAKPKSPAKTRVFAGILAPDQGIIPIGLAHVSRVPMYDSKPIVATPDRSLDLKSSPAAHSRKQQRLMVTALGLLVIALVSVLYHDRDFWFPEERQAEEHVPQTPPAIAQSRSGPIKHESFPAKMTHSKAQPVPQAAPDTRPAEDVPAVTATRTVLPPLEVEVIGGNAGRRLRPGSNTVRIDLERGSSPSRATPAPADPEPLPATLTSNAAERVEVSSDAGDLVTH